MFYISIFVSALWYNCEFNVFISIYSFVQSCDALLLNLFTHVPELLQVL